MANGQVTKMKAWLVTWEWIGDHAKRPNKVAAIFNPRLGGARVREFVEFLYLTESYTLSERMACAQHRTQNPYPAQFGQTRAGHAWEGEICCGHNPFLKARLVDDLTVERGANDEETVTWKERPRP